MVYGGSIEEVLKGLFGKFLDNIVLSLETSASYLGLASEDGFPLVFYTDNDYISNSGYIASIFVDKLDLEDTIVINGIRCTNKVKTICELIAKDRDDQCIYESIEMYRAENSNDLSALREKATSMGILKELEYYIEEASHYYED